MRAAVVVLALLVGLAASASVDQELKEVLAMVGSPFDVPTATPEDIKQWLANGCANAAEDGKMTPVLRKACEATRSNTPYSKKLLETLKRAADNSRAAKPPAPSSRLSSAPAEVKGAAADALASGAPDPSTGLYKTKPMLKGEAERDAENHVRYLTEIEKAQKQLYCGADSNGKLMDKYKNPLSGKFTYIMEANGDIFTGMLADKPGVQHSQYNRGAPVAAAGILVVNEGVLQKIDNESGHYRPDASFLAQAVYQLTKKCAIPVKPEQVVVIAPPVASASILPPPPPKGYVPAAASKPTSNPK